MLAYAARRFLGAIPTLFIIITLTFFMMRAAPGGPFDSERSLPPEIKKNVEATYNLDKLVPALDGASRIQKGTDRLSARRRGGAEERHGHGDGRARVWPAVG